jgi:hypothetical protein
MVQAQGNARPLFFQSFRPAAERSHMFQALRSARPPIDRALDSLPSEYHAVVSGQERIVVGPTGAFALTTPEPDVETAARRVGRVAGEVRGHLVGALSWAPFVDALVVVEGAGGRVENVGVVPTRLLTRMITDGPQVLAHELVDRMVAEIDQHAVAPR